MKGCRQIIAVLVVFAASACGPPPRDEELPVEPPFAKASVWSDRLYARLIPGTPLEAVVRIPIAPLEGGMTLEEAKAVAGPPLSWGRDYLGTYYYYGPTAWGIKLVHLQYKDSGPVDRWVVIAVPENDSLAAVVSPEMIALLSKAGAIAGVTVHEQKGPRLQAFSARVRDGRVSYLEWYSTAGIAGE